MGHFKELAIEREGESMADGDTKYSYSEEMGYFPLEVQHEEDLAGMQRQAAQSDLRELKGDLDYRIERLKYYGEPIKIEHLEALLRHTKRALRVLE